ncbi:MAG: hypothetical protein Q9Q40_03155 [Acidobacteriota bacterium]|nr:hypothetical protein [Acidobacteriota bacterium]MDQ7087721.1 hypothetical protein [Acidobacteriota bacterium]
MADWKSPMRADPSEWLVLNASAPIRYRLLTELHSLTTADPNVGELQKEVLSWKAGKQELRYQRQDGSWGGMIHGGDPKKAERSTEKILWGLYELGWDREFKEIRKAAKLLKSFLTQKRDLNLYEFNAQVKQDPVRERHLRWFLRICALGLLLRGGWHKEKKISDAVADLLDRVTAFVSDPVSRHPVEHVGVGLPQIRREAMRDGYCFIPDLYMLRVFAHYPGILDSAVLRSRLKKIFDYVLSVDYQELTPDIGAIRTVRGPTPRGWGIELHPLETYLEKGYLDELLYLLEQFARLGLINRYPRLMGYMDWLLAQQEKDGRWDLSAKYFGGKPLYGSWLRLERDWKSPTRRISDVTFRIMLILKYQWDRQVQMLNRGADVYGF